MLLRFRDKAPGRSLFCGFAVLVTMLSASAVIADTVQQSAYENAPTKKWQPRSPLRKIRQFPPTFGFNRSRAAKSLREITNTVDRMRERAKASLALPKFDADRAAKTLAAITSYVANMKATAPEPSTVYGEATGVKIHFFYPIEIPYPDQVDPQTGLTHSQLADQRLEDKGFTKTHRGWHPPQEPTQPVITTSHTTRTTSASLISSTVSSQGQQMKAVQASYTNRVTARSITFVSQANPKRRIVVQPYRKRKKQTPDDPF